MSFLEGFDDGALADTWGSRDDEGLSTFADLVH